MTYGLVQLILSEFNWYKLKRLQEVSFILIKLQKIAFVPTILKFRLNFFISFASLGFNYYAKPLLFIYCYFYYKARDIIMVVCPRSLYIVLVIV